MSDWLRQPEPGGIETFRAHFPDPWEALIALTQRYAFATKRQVSVHRVEDGVDIYITQETPDE